MSNLLDAFNNPSLSDTHQHQYDSTQTSHTYPGKPVFIASESIELIVDDENEMSAHWTQPMTKGAQFGYGLLNYTLLMLITSVVSYAFQAWTFLFVVANVCFIWLLVKTFFFSGREHHSMKVPQEKRLESEQATRQWISMQINQGYLST